MSCLTEIYRIMNSLLKVEDLRIWVDTPIPGLGGQTPFHMMSNGLDSELLDYVKTYLDPSFS